MARCWTGTHGHKVSCCVGSYHNFEPVLRRPSCSWYSRNKGQTARCSSKAGCQHWPISRGHPCCNSAIGSFYQKRHCGISEKVSLYPIRQGECSRLAAKCQAFQTSIGQSSAWHTAKQLDSRPLAIKQRSKNSCGSKYISRLNSGNAGNTMKECWSNGVLTATTGTTFKLFLVCGFVGWLLSTGRLSDETAPVLSKVVFCRV